MKKYDLRSIMRNAWAIRRDANVDMSTAMRAAWSLAKAEITADLEGKQSGWNYKVVTNDWCKYGNHRTYISTRIYTNAWNLKKEIKIGYVDNKTGSFVAA